MDCTLLGHVSLLPGLTILMFTYRVFHQSYQSTINLIYIALLFYSVDRKEFGNDEIFYKLTEELTFLQTTGIVLNLQQGNKILYFLLSLITAENLVTH